MIGGDDITTGEPTGEIWFRALSSDSWLPIPTEAPPEQVLAATYAHNTRSLYYLDEVLVPVEADPPGNKVAVCHVPPGNPDAAHTLDVGQGALGAHLGHGDAEGACPLRLVRLVQLDVDLGLTYVMASFERDRSWSEHALVLDRDGALLLASSNPGEDTHAITRIAIDGAPVVDGTQLGDHPLAYPPLVDAAGYTLVSWLDPATGAFERLRQTQLDLSGPGSLALLGDQL